MKDKEEQAKEKADQVPAVFRDRHQSLALRSLWLLKLVDQNDVFEAYKTATLNGPLSEMPCPKNFFEHQVSLAKFREEVGNVGLPFSDADGMDRAKAVEAMKVRTEKVNTYEVALRYALDAAKSSVSGFEGAVRSEVREKAALDQKAAADATRTSFIISKFKSATATHMDP